MNKRDFFGKIGTVLGELWLFPFSRLFGPNKYSEHGLIKEYKCVFTCVFTEGCMVLDKRAVAKINLP